MNLLETVERLQQTLSGAAKASLHQRFGALFDKVYRKDVLWDAWRGVASVPTRAGRVSTGKRFNTSRMKSVWERFFASYATS